MYSKEYLRQQIQSAFQADDVQGDLADLVADVLAEYAYLHQIIDINILMENSFLRSTKLNSRIQQAADRFYSVNRGHNRVVKINNLSVYKDGETIQPFEIITQNAGGKYKLYAQKQWEFEAGTQLTATGYLAIGSQSIELTGKNRLYMDVEGINTSGVSIANQNISEDMIIYRSYEELPETSDTFAFQTMINDRTIYYKEVKIVDSLTELFSYSNEHPSEECFCAMTMPNYGVRLFSPTVIPPTNKYLVKYLVCPDPTVEEKEPSSAIKQINNCKITNDTSFELLRSTDYREEDLDVIYLNASNNFKMSGVMKSINSLETLIPEIFPQFKSYKMLVGPINNTLSASNSMADDSVVLHDVVEVSDEYAVSGVTQENISSSVIEYVPNGTVYIWYVWDGEVKIAKNEESLYTSPTHDLTAQQQEWNKVAKAYYIPDGTRFFFKNINELPVPSPTLPIHVKGLADYKIKIYYSQNLDYQQIHNIIENFQYQIGDDFNPYKIISALVTDSTLYQKIKYAEILHKENGVFVPAQIVKIAQDQRWMFEDDYTDLVEFQQV